MSKTLKNTQAIQEMIAGTHRTQTKIQVSVPGSDEYSKIEVPRIIGSKWTDDDGNEWEQFDGYKINHGKLDYLRKELREFPNCYEKEKGNKCTKNSITTIPQDLKMKNITGRCLDCQIAFEHKLKISGEFEKYEKQKIYDNALAWLVEAEKDKETIKEQFRVMSYANPNGDAETWTDTKSFEERCIEIDDEFEKFRNTYIHDLEVQLGIIPADTPVVTDEVIQ